MSEMSLGNRVHSSWVYLNATDPDGVLQWLYTEVGPSSSRHTHTSQLRYAESHNEKVHIIGHIPPGNDGCLRVWSNNYQRLVNRWDTWPF